MRGVLVSLALGCSLEQLDPPDPIAPVPAPPQASALEHPRHGGGRVNVRAERAAPDPAPGVDAGDEQASVPPAVGKAEREEMARVIGRGAEQPDEVGVAADHPVEGHKICRRQVRFNIREIGMDERDTPGMPPSSGLFFGLLQIG